MNYGEVKQIFQELKRTYPKDDLTAHIIFTEDSFTKEYPLLRRTYRFGSDNKAFWPHMFSKSIFACCLDGTDQGVRLDWYMAEEGNPDGWVVEDCYILERMQDAAAIPALKRIEQRDGTVSYFFGDTFMKIFESRDDKGKIQLELVLGDQDACSGRVPLSIDQMYGYCALLERHLNKEAAG